MKYLDIPQWRSRFNNPWVARAGLACSSLLLLWSFWSGIQTLWLTPNPITALPFRPPVAINSNTLPTLHVFGANPTNLNDLPLASLGVTLLGIFSDGQGQSSALISMGSDSKPYHAGDSLAPNVTIEKILATSVVVLHNGKLEKLELPIKPLTFSNQLPHSTLWTQKA